MDKETLNNFMWIIVIAIVSGILIGAATPFGRYITSAEIFAIRKQTDQMVSVYEDEAIKDTTEEMRELFDSTSFLSPGLYTHNDQTQVLSWQQIKDDEYLSLTGTELHSSANTINLEGDLVIGDDVIKTTANLFVDCDKLEVVRFGSFMTVFNTKMFVDCDNLKYVVVSDAIKTVPAEGFVNCPSLISVKLPKGLQEIKENAFVNCAKLNKIEYGGTIAEWNNIIKPSNWEEIQPNLISCSDGKIEKNN